MITSVCGRKGCVYGEIFFNDAGGEEGFMEQAFPQCLKCNTGILLPLSDYGRDGAINHVQSMGMQQSQLRI